MSGALFQDDCVTRRKWFHRARPEKRATGLLVDGEAGFSPAALAASSIWPAEAVTVEKHGRPVVVVLHRGI
jgi:hypothetical protein